MRFVQMRIPVPPAGPLAVKMFHLEVPDGSAANHYDMSSNYHWKRASADFEMLPSKEVMNPLETFRIDPPVESHVIRLVLTRNMMGHMDPGATSVGFWSIRFL